MAKTIKSFDIASNIPTTDRDFLNVVHYEDKKRIITDGRFLVALSSAYPEAMEGVNIMTNFAVAGELLKFPNWKRVIPDTDEGYKTVSFGENISLNDDVIKSYKLNKNKKDKFINILDDGYLLGKLNTKYWDLLLEFIRLFDGDVKIFVSDDVNMRRAWKVEAADQSFFLVMPCADEFNFDYSFDIKTGELKVN